MMRALLLASVVACGLVSISGPARAQDHALFGNSDQATAPRATLTFDALTPFIAVDTGWIDSTGRHLAGNMNYFTGTASGVNYNSFFNFALGAVRPVSPYTSAVLTLQTGVSIGDAPFQISFFDVGASLLALDSDRASGDTTGQSLYADLGSGISYGSYSVTAPTSLGQTVLIPLNQAFLEAVNGGLLTTFSIGGTLTPSAVAVAEPASLALLGMGVAGMAAVRRRREGLALPPRG